MIRLEMSPASFHDKHAKSRILIYMQIFDDVFKAGKWRNSCRRIHSHYNIFVLHTHKMNICHLSVINMPLVREKSRRDVNSDFDCDCKISCGTQVEQIAANRTTRGRTEEHASIAKASICPENNTAKKPSVCSWVFLCLLFDVLFALWNLVIWNLSITDR